MTADPPDCRSAGTAAFPHTDPATAVNLVLETFPQAP
jgi:hypothetical protein